MNFYDAEIGRVYVLMRVKMFKVVLHNTFYVEQCKT